MRYQHESHANIGRYKAKELLERLQAAGRCPKADDGKIVWCSFCHCHRERVRYPVNKLLFGNHKDSLEGKLVLLRVRVP